MVQGRYRAVVCGVNADDNSHGVIAQIVDRVATSQWSAFKEREITEIC